MVENREKGERLKVDDRRTSMGGKKKESEKREAEPSGEDAGKEEPREGHEGVSGREVPPGEIPEVDFSTFIFSLLTSALIQLGDMADPLSGNMGCNIAGAKQTIDILDIIRVKTEGNLTEEEDKLIKNATTELKWKYLDAVKEKG